MKRFNAIIVALAVFAGIAVAGPIDFEFESSYDGSQQPAAGFVPDDLEQNPAPRPLLVVAHFMGGDRYTAQKQGYYEEAAKRGWLVVSPELHGKNSKGGKISCASLEAQHDILDSIAYMRKNYPVDTRRIYIAGRSMGGMMTQIMIAKYPDLFAAGVAGQGCSDITRLDEFSAAVAKAIPQECGDDPFEYQRRSSIYYARNFAYAPLIIWHGTNDGLVDAAQSKRLYDAIVSYQPYAIPVFWLPNGSHLEENYMPEWICDQLENYRTSCDWPDMPFRWFPELNLITDESKAFFYLDVKLADENRFGTIKTSLAPKEGEFDRSMIMAGCNSEEMKPVVMTINVSNIAEVTVNFDNMPEPLRPAEVILVADKDSQVALYRVINGSKEPMPAERITRTAPMND